MAKKLHVVMLPWCAFGHLIPFFQLSVALAKSGVKVSYVSTPRNIQRLPKIPSSLEKLLNFIELPLPTLPDNYNSPEFLQEGAEATVDLPVDKVEYLKIAYDLLEEPFKQIIVELSPDWVIFDMVPHWAAEVARENQVQLMFFSVFSACSAVFIGNPESMVGEGQKRLRPSWVSWTSPPEWVDFPSKVAYKKHEAIGIHEWVYGVNASGMSDAERVFKVLTSCQAVAIRSCPVYEGDYLNLYGKILGKPVVPVGLLLPEEKHDKGRRNLDDSWEGIFDWLDGQRSKSVVFVGFGSEFKLSKEHVYEIAYGLELSGLPFLWSLRRPDWASDDIDALPPGLAERTSGRGRVCLGWAPQLEILSHPSIGGSLFHSGWGSIIETLQYGHALVLLPFIIDQPLNARLLVEKGLGVEVERNEDGSFSRDGVAKALMLAMVSDEGKELRKKAREAVVVFGNRKLQQDYMDEFVGFLKSKQNLADEIAGEN